MHTGTLGDVMVSALTSNIINDGFDPWSGETKDYQSGICNLSAEQRQGVIAKNGWLKTQD